MKIKIKDSKDRYKLVLRIDEDVNTMLDKLINRLDKSNPEHSIGKTKLINAILRKALKDSELEIEI